MIDILRLVFQLIHISNDIYIYKLIDIYLILIKNSIFYSDIM